MRPILILLFITFAVTACKKNTADKSFHPRKANAGPPYDEVILLPNIINEDIALIRGNLYILDGKCYVVGNHVLFIEEGTRIEAVRKPTNDEASALIVTRGSQLFAAGSSTSPIVFTSHEANPQPGDWGGVVLLGNAPINQVDQPIEGINLPGVPAGVDVWYGGGGAGLGDPHHSAGELSHAIIEYAGVSLTPDNELNGLTCGGVGDGTVLDYIEVALGNDDAFQFFGGTVNAKHLFALAPRDEAFDYGLGYNGKLQYAYSLLRPVQTFSPSPNGLQSESSVSGSPLPVTNPIISNMTVTGYCDAFSATPLQNSVLLRQNTNYVVRNSEFWGYPVGVRFQSGATPTNFQYNTVHGFQAVAIGGILDGTNTTILGALPSCSGPGSGSCVTRYTGLASYPGFFDSCSCRGAFASGNWLAGWAKFDY